MLKTESANKISFGKLAVSITLWAMVGGLIVVPARVSHAQLIQPLQSHFDIFPGKNTAGPYNLSWTNIASGPNTPIEIMVDGQILTSDKYHVDPVKGQVTFNTTLSESSVARVTYQYDPLAAKSNPAYTSQPLYLPVTKFGENTLNVIALPSGDPQKSGSIPLVFSLGGQTHLLGGGLTSAMNMTGGQRNGVQVGFQRGTSKDKNMVNAAYTRSGKDFATSAGKAVGMGDAVQHRALDTLLTPSKYMATSYKLLDDVNFVTNTRKAQETYNLRFGEGGTRPTLSFVRNDSLTITPDKKETRTYSDHLDVGTGLNKVTTLGFNRAEDTSVTPDNKETVVTKDTLDLKTKLSQVTGIDLNRSENTTVAPDNSETRVTTDKIDVSKRIDKMTSVSATTLESVTDGSKSAVDALSKGAIFALTSTGNNGAKQATATVNTGSKQSKTGVELDRTVQFRFQPAPVFIVSASQTEQKVTPVNSSGVEGTPNTVLTQTATAEIVPLPNTKMTSAIAETTNNDVKVSSTNFGAEVGTGKNVQIKANVINRSSEAPGNSPLDTTQTQVALHPLKNFTVTGGYTWNPVDPANGTVHQQLRQEVGMTAKMGKMDVGSGYAITTVNGVAKTDTPDPQFGTVSLKLGMNFSKTTIFNGSYNDSLHYHDIMEVVPGQVPKYQRSYTFGLTHNMGPGFNLTLGGTRIDDRSRAQLPTDVKADAKLGVLF